MSHQSFAAPWLGGIALLLALLFVAPARADTQTLHFAAPGWHYISLAVTPVNKDPALAFPESASFRYDHLWSFDASEGWRHFSPPSISLPEVFNDLDTLHGLRGYWIHVTAVPPGGATLLIEGVRTLSQRLELPGGTSQAWHPIGPLLPPGTTSAPVASVFGELGDALPTSILQVWRYDRETDQLLQITDFSADCAATPEDCLAEGRGYWVRTDGSVAIGKRLEVLGRGVVLSSGRPSRLIEIEYEGIGPVAARLRAEDPASGLVFVAARRNRLDGESYPEPDVGGDPAGPETEVDLDGDGIPEPCPDLCAGTNGCVNLCFATGGSRHELYVVAELETLTNVERFSSLEPGREHARLLLELGSDSSGSGGAFRARARAAALPSATAVDDVRVALKPSVLRGVYAGTFVYDERDSGEVPLTLWLDDCIRDPASGAEDCSTGRVTGVINPTLLGSTGNGIDDDGDGDVDEPGEAGQQIRMRDSPGFASETILRGEISSNQRWIQLEGMSPSVRGLAFARGICATGLCAGGGTSCTSDADCTPEDAGIASAFSGASRTLTLVGQRLGPEILAGFFTDLYTGISLGNVESAPTTGRFVLTRVLRPQCVAASSLASSGLRSVSLNVDCRRDADCPGFCTGEPALEGFSCTTDADCQDFDANGVTVSGTCQRFTCGFSQLAAVCSSTAESCQSDAECVGGSCLKTASRRAIERTDSGVEISGLDRQALVELLGPESLLGIVKAQPGQSAVSFAAISCGLYTVRVSAQGCDELTTLFDPCSDPPPLLGPLNCPGPSELPASSSPASSGGPIRLIAGHSLTGGDPTAGPRLTGGPGTAVTLRGLGGESAMAGRDLLIRWTNVLLWPGEPAELRTGLLEVF